MARDYPIPEGLHLRDELKEQWVMAYQGVNGTLSTDIERNLFSVIQSNVEHRGWDEQRISELEAKLAALQRPFSDAEVVSEWPGASVAEAGLANAMLIRRIGWDKWPKEAIELTIKIDAERKRNPPVQP